MKLGEEILYLSNADIEGADMPPTDLAASVEAMLAQKAVGRTVFKPKLGLYPKPGTFFQAMAGVMAEPAYAAVKWTGVVHDNDQRGLPHVSPLILLNDAETGLPLALMDGKWITGHRTPAITVVGAKYLARKDSTTMGFIACGLQARTHLRAFMAAFPIAHVVAYSRRRATAEAFAAEVRAIGLDVEVVEEPRAAVEGLDIVISSVPESPGLEPFLDPGWLARGAFAGMTDVARSWRWAGTAAPDVMATDDHDQSATMVKAGRLAYDRPFDTDLAQLVSGAKPGRENAEQRTGLIFSGLALADVAVAGTFYERALAQEFGTVLPL